MNYDEIRNRVCAALGVPASTPGTTIIRDVFVERSGGGMVSYHYQLFVNRVESACKLKPFTVYYGQIHMSIDDFCEWLFVTNYLAV